VNTEAITAFHLSGNYAPVSYEVTATDLPVEGRIPESLSGRYVRNGPNPKPGAVSPHWFYGDGMVHGVELAAGRARWYRNRWIRTSTFTDDTPVLRRDLTIDRTAGVANTNVVHHGGRTLALVETSFPYALTDTLDTIGPYDFDGKLTTAMTAHPKMCPTSGELHFFGYALSPPYLTYHCADATGRLVRSRPIDVPGPTMMHDFAITATNIVFLDLPVIFDPVRAMSGMPFRWDDDYGARIGVLSRSTPEARINWYDIEPCYVFHVLNAYDAGDAVVLDALRYPEIWRDGSDNFGASTLHRWTLRPGSRVKEEALDDHIAEFPRIDDRRVGLEHRYGYAVHHIHPATGFILRYDLAMGTADRISVGEGHVPSEAVFVPANDDGCEDGGFLMAFVYDHTRDRSELALLQADEPAAPPLATVQLPQRVPYGFHGNWIQHHP
jgi:carotenoid cleavage dioxygenase-like enzyme